jgi:hypothetical protein
MSRLTKKENNIYTFTHTNENRQFVVYDLCNKLGKLEDILEEYGIEDLTDLKIALDYYNHRFDDLHTERVDTDEQNQKNN